MRREQQRRDYKDEERQRAAGAATAGATQDVCSCACVGPAGFVLLAGIIDLSSWQVWCVRTGSALLTNHAEVV